MPRSILDPVRQAYDVAVRRAYARRTAAIIHEALNPVCSTVISVRSGPPITATEILRRERALGEVAALTCPETAEALRRVTERVLNAQLYHLGAEWAVDEKTGGFRVVKKALFDTEVPGD